MVHISRSINDKVTVEYTLEELSGVENDLDVYVNSYDDMDHLAPDPTDATYEFLEKVKAFRASLLPKTPFDG